MRRENEAYKEVLSQVSEVVNEMYEKYRKRCGLEEEKDTERQLDILVNKKYIAQSYITDIEAITKYHERSMLAMYHYAMADYKVRVMVQTEKIPY